MPIFHILDYTGAILFGMVLSRIRQELKDFSANNGVTDQARLLVNAVQNSRSKISYKNKVQKLLLTKYNKEHYNDCSN